MDRRTIGLMIIVIGIVGILAYPIYTGFTSPSVAAQGFGSIGPSSGQPQIETSTTITLDDAKAIAQQYLTSVNDPNLAIKEIMEFQYNFYIVYYEEDTGIGAFEMLIWKQVPPQGMMGGGYGMGGMMGGYRGVGVITPEPGPNMMWNTKYGMMRTSKYGSTTVISGDRAAQLAQQCLNTSINGARVEAVTPFHGYYTFDFIIKGKIAGMLSVNAYTGQVWYHSWHGAFIQEVEYD